LPDNVRISSVRPKVDKDGVITVTMTVLARSVEGVNTFIESLEKDGAFSGLLSTDESFEEDGLLQATIEGRYAPPRTVAGKGVRP
jgi:hypothetical protein